MTDGEYQQLFDHYKARDPEQGLVLFARMIESVARAECADEIHTGHENNCTGNDCDCRDLHLFLRTKDPTLRAQVLHKANPEAFEIWKTGHVLAERTRLEACIDGVLSEVPEKQRAQVQEFADRLRKLVTEAPIH